MRMPALLLLCCLSACTSSLKLGDRAFAEGRYPDAVRAYERASPEEPDAVLFRMAVLHATPASPYFDPESALRLLTRLRDEHPTSPYGLAARHALDERQRRLELEERLRALEGQLAALSEEVTRKDAELAIQVQTHQATVGKLETLDHEARRVHEELQQLKDENARLSEELEALKRIDLRH